MLGSVSEATSNSPLGRSAKPSLSLVRPVKGAPAASRRSVIPMIAGVPSPAPVSGIVRV